MAVARIYIAGPMRGYPRFNVDAFDQAAARWSASGWYVVNPAEMDRRTGVDHDADPATVNLRACMRRDLLAILDRCSAIALLPGWEQSNGVRVELALARFLGLDVYDAVTFERIEDEDDEPAPEPTIEPGEEFGSEKFELAKQMQDEGVRFEFWNGNLGVWKSPYGGNLCAFADPNDRYRRIPASGSASPASPAIQATEKLRHWCHLHDGPDLYAASKLRKGAPGENILAEAMRITAGDRQASYGPPDQDFARTAAMWSAIKGVEFEAREVALFMILLKVSRETHQRKRDNAVDIAGYAKCLDICNQAAKERGQ